MEKLSSLKESSAWAQNQNVLNSLSEDADGNLLYKGKKIGGERLTATKEFTFGDKISVEFVGESDYIGYFYEENADIPIGTEIANVELCILDDYWVSIKNTINQVSVDDDTGYIAFARVFPQTSDSLIPTQLLGAGITSARITYYTD